VTPPDALGPAYICTGPIVRDPRFASTCLSLGRQAVRDRAQVRFPVVGRHVTRTACDRLEKCDSTAAYRVPGARWRRLDRWFGSARRRQPRSGIETFASMRAARRGSNCMYFLVYFFLFFCFIFFFFFLFFIFFFFFFCFSFFCCFCFLAPPPPDRRPGDGIRKGRIQRSPIEPHPDSSAQATAQSMTASNAMLVNVGRSPRLLCAVTAPDAPVRLAELTKPEQGLGPLARAARPTTELSTLAQDILLEDVPAQILVLHNIRQLLADVHRVDRTFFFFRSGLRTKFPPAIFP